MFWHTPVRSDGSGTPTAVSPTSQRQSGVTDSPTEDRLEEAFNRVVDEGSQRLHQRLHRNWREVLETGFFGGTEVAMAERPRSDRPRVQRQGR